MDGLQGKYHQLNLVLKTVDWDLYLALHKQQIHPQFYAFRWLSLLFAQEFSLPDIERLWDTLFSDNDRFSYSIIVAVAMLVLERSVVLAGNFNETMHQLQHYSHSIDETLYQAHLVGKKYSSDSNAASNSAASLNEPALEMKESSPFSWINRKLNSAASKTASAISSPVKISRHAKLSANGAMDTSTSSPTHRS